MHPGKLIPFAIVGAVLIIGGSYAWNVSYQENIATERLEAMSSKLAEINSAGFDGTFEMRMHADETTEDGFTTPAQDAHVQVAVTGAQDVRDINNPRATMTIAGSFDDGASVAPTTSAKFEMRVIGEIVYVKLVSAPDIEFFDLKPFIGTWIRIDPRAIAEQFGITEADLDEAQAGDRINQAKAERLRKLWEEAHVLKIVSVKSGEMIDGVDTYHYVFEVQKPELIAYIKKVSMELEEKSLSPEELKKIETELQDFDLPQGELWIGKEDLFLRRVHVDHHVEPTKEEPVTLSVLFDLKLKNINQPVSVVAPLTSKSIEEVMQELFAKVGVSAGVQGE